MLDARPLGEVEAPFAPGSALGRPRFVLGHRPILDGLRAVACLLVMAHHINGLGGGFLGVEIFFVLSGFLISSLLLEEWSERGRLDLGRFFARRALRLLPALFLFVLAMVVLGLVIPGAARLVSVKWVSGTLLYVVNWLIVKESLAGASIQSAFVHCWSLAIEEQFYLVWPLVLAWLLRKRAGLRSLAILLLAVVVYAAVARLLIFSSATVGSQMRAYAGSDTRADGLALGCLLAVLAHHGRLPRMSRGSLRVLLAVAVAVLAFAIWKARIAGGFIYLGGLSAVGLATSCVLYTFLFPAALPRPLRGVLESRAAVLVGRMSYGLYLWHLPAVVLVKMAYGRGLAASLLPWLLSFAVAGASFAFVERPFLRLKRKLRVSDDERAARLHPRQYAAQRRSAG